MEDSADRLAWSSTPSLGGLTAFNNKQQSFNAKTRTRKPFIKGFFQSKAYTDSLVIDKQMEEAIANE